MQLLSYCICLLTVVSIFVERKEVLKIGPLYHSSVKAGGFLQHPSYLDRY